MKITNSNYLYRITQCFIITLIIFISGCSEDDSPTIQQADPSYYFLDIPNVNMASGSSVDQLIEIKRTNFNDKIPLKTTVSNLDPPLAGVEITFDPNPIPEGSLSSNMHIETEPDAVIRGYVIRINHDGYNLQTNKNFALNIYAFLISIPDSGYTVGQGNSITIPITITRAASFTDPISFGWGIAPVANGISATINPNPTNTNSSDLTLDIAVNASLGSFTFTISATSGNITEEILMNLTIAALPQIWSDVTPDPAPPILYDIDGNYAAGQNGTILRTSNEGLNWEYLSSGTSSHLRAVLDAGGTIYVAGDNGTVLKGGGSSWADISIPDAPDLYDIHKVNGHLWAVGTDGAGAVAFKSRDDGMTWMKSNTPYNQSFYPIFLGVSFSDTSNGILVGNLHSNIFRTIDAGENWDIIPVDPFQLEDISGNVACGINGSIISTPDGGSTWQNLNIGTFGNLSSFSDVIYVGYNETIVRQEAGNFIAEYTGIQGFQSTLLGVTFNGTHIAVGNAGAGVGIIIKRQPL